MPFPLWIALLVKLGEPVDRTLWLTVPVAVQVQVTVPLTATVSTAGSEVRLRSLRKKLFPTVTATVDGGPGGGGGDGGSAAVAVAVNSTGEPVAPTTSAWASCEPTVEPSVQVAALIPSAFVCPDLGAREPSSVDQVTVTPDSGTPSLVTTTPQHIAERRVDRAALLIAARCHNLLLLR